MSIKTKIVGVTRKNSDGTKRQDLLEMLKRHREKELVLMPEPDNPASDHAIAVYDRTGDQLGYLKDDLAEELFDELQEIGTAYAEVLEVTGGDGKSYGCNIEIPYDDEEGLTHLILPENYGKSDSATGMFMLLVIFVVIAFIAWLFLRS